MNIPSHLRGLLWFAFFVAFAVKIPTWPLHLWLP
jgi:NADH:ubiquinone oxidoreductase subunit 4 (subunit M)